MGSITVHESETEEVVVIVGNSEGTVICAGTKGGPEVRIALLGLLETFLGAGATPPVYLFVDQATATVRQVKSIDGLL